MNKKGLSGTRAITSIFAAASFLTGLLLIDRGSISGNVIVGSEPLVSTFSMIGLVFVFLSVILAAYSIKRR